MKIQSTSSPKPVASSYRQIAAGQNEASLIAEHLKSPTLMMLVLVAAIGAFIYGSFLLNPANRGDLLPYLLAISAEAFILSQAFLSLWTILASGYNPRNFEFHLTQDNLFGRSTKTTLARALARTPTAGTRTPMRLRHEKVTIDVFITVYGEDLTIIRQTAEAARDMIGAHTTTILDDGDSDDVISLAKELDIGYIRRKTHEGAKAGNINHALTITNGNLYAIFDADFVPDRLFLYETVPFFENERVAFVQTPQHYDNDTTIISKGAGFMQHVFYALIQPGKNRFNAAFCVGTNVVFRRAATDTIGGVYQGSKSEDIWTSILLHEQGYESVYIPNVLAVGKTPESIKTYSKQQLRWATGGFEIFFRHNPLFRKTLSVDQKVQYFGTITYYFNGLAILFLLLLPPLQIFFNLTPVNLDISTLQWAFYYSSFYIMQIVVAFYTMGGFKLETLILSSATFPVYIKALVNAVLRRDLTWQATGRVGKVDSPFNYIFPQVYIFIFLLLTTIVGIWKSRYTHEFSIAVMWNALNTLVFGSFFFIALKESHEFRKQHRQEKRMRRRALKLQRRIPVT